ncbi:MAG: exported protein of unknown function [Chthoniobacteraceae bacterium]|nr:exported protein of unknown function [Chthoniobacteraceae bacterium]
MKLRFFLFLLAIASLLHAGPPVDGVVTFNEIMYHPASGGDAGEWIELHNQMGVAVDLSGWKIEGAIDFAFPNGTVIVGGTDLVIAKTPASFPGSLGPFTGTLNNSGETLRLVDNNARLMDQVSYSDGGDWPVAADGSGVSLSKRSADSGSVSALNWTTSTLVGGTPGAANFPPPPLPVTTRVIGLASTWKFNNSGAAPDPAWKTTTFSEAGWTGGLAGFDFGDTTIFQDAPAQNAGGIWSVLPWSGDGDSRIASTKSYTHKIGLNRGSAYTAINGVVFDSPGTGVTSGANWALLGATDSFTGNGTTGGSNNLPAGTGSRQLCEEFLYGAAYTGGVSRIQLAGLTAGQTYTTTFYATGYGDASGRLVRITPSDSNAPYVVDENATNSGNGLLLRYHYTAPGNGVITFDFLPLSAGTWHHYAFSNEVAGAITPETGVTGVTVAGFSSELTSGGFTRGAVNTVNGSGLNAGQHGTTPEGAMWLSTGTFLAPNDPLPAVITYDLGAAVHLTSLHVWNYNETNLSSRGAKQVEVLVSPTPGGPFTSAGTFTFIKASAAATEPGQHLEIDQPNVRQVRFNIVSNYGDANQLTGLSEIRFFKEGLPPDPTPVPYKAAITTLFNTGLTQSGTLAAVGSGDVHFANAGVPAIVQAAHPAWLGPDGISQWIGLSASGQDNVATGQFTYRTTFSLSDYNASSAEIKFYVASDNSLDNVLLNGTAKSVSAGGFASMLGPFTISGPFNAGANTVDFVWTNAGDIPNPGGLRIKWEAQASPHLKNTTLSANPVATYFRQKFSYNGNPLSAYRLLLNYIADDGAVFYLNGEELHRVNMPAGAPTEITNASSDVVYPRLSGQLEVPAGALLTGENVLAVELHQSSSVRADAFFLATLDVVETVPLPSTAKSIELSELGSATAAAGTFFIELHNTTTSALTLTGYSLRSSSGAQYTFPSGLLAPGAFLSLSETTLGFRPLDGEKLFLISPVQTTVLDAVILKNHAQARDASGRFLTPNVSSPGTANTFSLNTAIVINEIMYHHHPNFLATGAVDSPEEWVELYNRSTAAVDLRDWKLRGGLSFDFAAGTILPAGGYLVLARDAQALLAKFPGINAIGNLSGSLSHSDDVVRIEDANGNPVNEVHYYHGGRWDERAAGGGSSLELRNPMMDNSVPEAWTASDESAKSAWQTFAYQGTAAIYPGSNEPNIYNEFVAGLLSSGEFLIDDISVKEVSVGSRECIQNGNFESGTATAWRLLGNHGSHGRSIVVNDPAAGGGKVLKVVATGATEHMHNHCETTLKSGGSYVTIQPANTYNISFRARWLSGSPRLQTRLYFNRLVRQHLLPIPANTGTPGTANSAFIPNAGPTYTGLSHSPVLPEAGAPVSVRVAAADSDGIAQLKLQWRIDGTAWNSSAMTLKAGYFEGTIPPQIAGSLVQFYVEGKDTPGAISTFPAAGIASRAFIRWQDGTTPASAAPGLRILMATADADFMHSATNVMSNDGFPCTIVYRENEVFYDATVRLKSSMRGRFADIRLGFAIGFDPMHVFRGAHEGINLDRSGYGRGTTGSGNGQSEIIDWHFFNRAGGIPSMYNDLAYLIAPRNVHTGSAMLTMAEFNDVYLDSQYSGGANTPTFKYELIYYPTTTTGGPEGLKLPQPDNVIGVEFGTINSADKEAFRWNFLIGNARSDDDFTRLINLNNTFRLAGASYAAALPGAIDVNQWLRTAAALSLAGIGDNYATTSGAWHNLKLYHRPDGRILYLPWDLDFQDRPANDPLVINPDISAIMAANPANDRLFYGHLLDIINTSFNSAYLSSWVSHYQAFTTSGGNWNEILTYVDARTAFVQTQINAAYPPVAFTITTNGGNDFTAAGPTVTLSGNGWINVRTIRVKGSGLALNVTWTGRNSWQVAIPVAPGANAIVIEGVDPQGNVVGSDTIAVTSTGSIAPAAAGNLVVSELHYNPMDLTAAEQTQGITDHDDFEFIEIMNISNFSVNLAGVRFVGGIDYNLPGATIPPGARLIIPRRTAAFAMRHPGVTAAPEYYQPGVNFLSNSGEELALIAANGIDIERFNYKDAFPWPVTPDGSGPSLVRIAPRVNSNPNDPLNWRASSANEGNPGGSDAITPPVNPDNDDDNDGIPNLAEYARGAGAAPVAVNALFGGIPFLTFSIERNPFADASWEIETSTSLSNWSPVAGTLTTTGRTTLPDGIERITFRGTSPIGATPSQFLRTKIRVNP